MRNRRRREAFRGRGVALRRGMVALLLAIVWMTPLSAGLAQEAKDKAALPKDAQAAHAAAPAARAPSAAGDSEQLDERESYLRWMIRANGWIFGPVLLGLSFAMVALVVMNILEGRRENFIPLGLVEQFDAQLKERRWQEAYEAARKSESFLGRVLAAGMLKLSGGGAYEQAVEAMQEEGEKDNMALEHKLSYLALIGSIAPMVGLMGTVYGMIDSFRVIADSDVSPPPKQLANGISTALFTTLEGLAIAIPAIAAYGILRNRMARLVLEVGIVGENLMGRFGKAAKRGAAGVAPAASGAPAARSAE